jgi:transketolase
VRNAFLGELTALAEKDPDVVLITGDLGFGVFEEFAERFPKQFLNAGVAEQNMTMVATGMALEGKKVFTYSIGNFPTLRCLEQIRNDVCYHNANVTIIGMGGGFSYGQLGMSHHATEDLSIMRALPNMTVVVPSTAGEVSAAMQALYQTPGPAYLRLDKSKYESDQDNAPFELGRARLVRDGEALTFVTAGGILQEVAEAADNLMSNGVSCRILSMHTIKPLDHDALNSAASETGGIVTVEENTIVGGLGSAVAEFCLEQSIKPGFFKRIGLQDTYSSVVGDQKYLREFYQMDATYLIDTVNNLLLDKGNETTS